MFVKALVTVIRRRKTILLDLRPCLYQSVYKYQKDSKNNAVTKFKNVEVGTNVKPLGEKVKETTKTASYVGIILLGIGVTGTLFYAVFSELFSSKSPNNVYTKAAKRCTDDPRIQDKLGLPITSYGEETRRGRRQHVNYLKFKRGDIGFLRMRFYLQGAFNKATVHLEMQENASGNYEYRYLIVEVNDMFNTTIVLEDNRQVNIPSNSSELLLN
ncbi:mitochondrial import inner membrane translocase subunit Tim21-like [Agrilus planipennis]|uniref:Mitochondrial import inner membrane translocase subunit Tim21 n=1 Tax=Agrilus planipennis TaxID=224129 RepID=A0A1W4WES9_AGRPL|nr:mitochondrial import inner membrane translocase subunit Tim21 [Agrilus planipennis]XP_025831920.1 mitochondrial import inner membrane translocase subunit Tim21-like [Agrilus planipennis]